MKAIGKTQPEQPQLQQGHPVKLPDQTVKRTKVISPEEVIPLEKDNKF